MGRIYRANLLSTSTFNRRRQHFIIYRLTADVDITVRNRSHMGRIYKDLTGDVDGKKGRCRR